MTEFYHDSLYLYPGRSISEFLDPGLFEICHRSASGLSAPPPFLETAPLSMAVRTVNPAEFSGQWIFWLILLGFSILTIARYYYLKRLKLLFSSVIKRSASLQLIRESPVHAHQSFIPLLAIYVIAFTLLVHQVIEIFSPGTSEGIISLLNYIEMLGVYLAFFLLKILIIWIISIIFKNTETGFEYIQNIIIFNFVLGILILPLLLLITYTYQEIFVYVTLAMMFLIMAMRFFRGIAIGLSDTKFSLFHLFLYLCTLEILPVVIGVKFLSKYFF